MKLFFSLFIVLFFAFNNYCNSQQLYNPINTELDFRIEKKLFADSNFHSSIKPFRYSKIFISDEIDSNLILKTNNSVLRNVLNSSVFRGAGKTIYLEINPILEFSSNYNSSIKENNIDIKTGVSLSGNITKKFSFNFDGFYGIGDKRINQYLPNDSLNIVPHFGQTYNETADYYSFFSFNGYLSYSPTNYLNFQAGKDKNFWGEGYRSLFLSDNSNSYPFIKTSIDIWKFKYIWLISALKDANSDESSYDLKRKYSFSHFLSWNATDWLNLNFFETIISNPIDSLGINYFNINYLNPVIFLRPVEFAGGSADNAILGFGFKIKILKKYQIYSQFVIDEFILAEIKSNNDWWGNKFGFQIGTKAFNFLNIKSLLVLAEYNYIRPFTYSYSNTIQNYGNFYQAMAHPSGANVKEIVLIANYHYKRLSFQLKGTYSISGFDTDLISNGNNIYKSYDDREKDYGNYMTQGLKSKYYNIELSNKWIINPKYKIALYLNIANTAFSNTTSTLNNTTISIGVKSLLFNCKDDFVRQ